MSADWLKKDLWKNEGDGFVVELSRHDGYDKGNNWCLYCYVFRNHNLYKKIAMCKSIYDVDVPMHGGCTFLKTHENGCIQFGCDYSHYGDEYYSRLDATDGVGMMLQDAQYLFNWISTYHEAIDE